MSLVAHNRTGEPVLALRSPPPLRELFRAARSIHGLGARRATQSHGMLDRLLDGRCSSFLLASDANLQEAEESCQAACRQRSLAAAHRYRYQPRPRSRSTLRRSRTRSRLIPHAHTPRSTLTPRSCLAPHTHAALMPHASRLTLTRCMPHALG